MQYENILSISDQDLLSQIMYYGPSPAVLSVKGVYAPGSPAPGFPVSPTFSNYKDGTGFSIVHLYPEHGGSVWHISTGVFLEDGQKAQVGSAVASYVTKGKYAALFSSIAAITGSQVKLIQIDTYINSEYEKFPIWLGWCNYGWVENGGVIDLSVGCTFDKDYEMFYKCIEKSSTGPRAFKTSGGDQRYNEFRLLLKWLKANSTIDEKQFEEVSPSNRIIVY